MYEEYMHDLLGIKNENYRMNRNILNRTIHNLDVENYYPEIYNIIYPMIKAKCMCSNINITNKFIDELTNDIYNNIEENISEKPINDNNYLKDLIKILIIRELNLCRIFK